MNSIKLRSFNSWKTLHNQNYCHLADNLLSHDVLYIVPHIYTSNGRESLHLEQHLNQQVTICSIAIDTCKLIFCLTTPSSATKLKYIFFTSCIKGTTYQIPSYNQLITTFLVYKIPQYMTKSFIFWIHIKGKTKTIGLISGLLIKDLKLCNI